MDRGPGPRPFADDAISPCSLEVTALKNYELTCAVTSIEGLNALPLEQIDSVYLGNPYCSLIAGNFASDKTAMLEALILVKSSGKKAYLTTPVISFGKDLEDLKALIDAAVSAGIDALEAQDVGIFRFVRENYPDLAVHLGHFMNIYNEQVGALYVDLGATRIIPSYELTLSEKKFFTSLGCEIEVPVHGKLPIGMAHACLLAMELPSRVPIPCTQQCREVAELVLNDWKMRCTGKSMLMAEDLTMIEFLPLLFESGFDRFRMDLMYNDVSVISPLVSLYRSALDKVASGATELKSELAEVRDLLDGKICNGWYFGASGRAYLDEDEKDQLEDHVADLMSLKLGASE